MLKYSWNDPALARAKPAAPPQPPAPARLSEAEIARAWDTGVERALPRTRLLADAERNREMIRDEERAAHARHHQPDRAGQARG